jgi:hypothetical protein
MSGRGTAADASVGSRDMPSGICGLGRGHFNERLSELFYDDEDVERALACGRCLDLMRCLADGESLSAPQLSAKTARPLKPVVQDLELLDSLYLVKKTGDPDDGEQLYTATLDEHRGWVRREIEEHRHHKAPWTKHGTPATPDRQRAR